MNRQPGTWPQTLLELDALGLPPAWRDWLQSLIASGIDIDIDIAQIVRASLLALPLSRDAGSGAQSLELPSRFGSLISGHDGDREFQQLVQRQQRLAGLDPAGAGLCASAGLGRAAGSGGIGVWRGGLRHSLQRKRQDLTPRQRDPAPAVAGKQDTDSGLPLT